jgi:hypothetical protein
MQKKNPTHFSLKRISPWYLGLLLPVLFANTLFAQTPTVVYGESLFRSNGYGVTNHNFRLRNFVPATGFNFITNATTGPCGNEIYMATTQPSTVNLNTIAVLPSSANTNADYLNGVTTFDLTKISAHIAGTVSLNSLVPTSDGPYRRISADANNDNTITQADIDMIRQLILRIRTNLSRNSWEWVQDYEVRVLAPTSFNTNPYNFVISYNWPGVDGIFMSGTYADITSANWKYYTYCATKVGDIVATGSSSSNNWVCGTGTYRAEVAAVAKNELSATSIKANTHIKIGVDVTATESLNALELPIDINSNDFEVVNVQFAKGFDAQWHYAKDLGKLTFVALEASGKAFATSSGNLITVELKAKQTINDISKSIKWSSDRSIELINTSAELVKGTAKLITKEIVANDLYATINSGAIQTLNVFAKTSTQASIQVVTINGQNIWNTAVRLKTGTNQIALPQNTEKGIYIVNVQTKENKVSLKYTN